MAEQNNLAPQLWHKVVDVVKDRVNNRSLWQTMEKAVGITIDNGVLIVGLNSRFFNEAGHLNVSEHRNAIETAASQLAGRPLRIRVIEGDTQEDWVNTQKRDARVAAMRSTTYDRRDRQVDESQSWDALQEQISRAYSNTPMRALPQSKARFLTDALYMISDAMDSLYDDAEPDENTERMLARVIDRVATNAEVASTVVAMELERVRAWRKQNPE